MDKAKSAIDKIKEISAKFDAADKIVEASKEIEEVSTEIIECNDYSPNDVLPLKIMADDFKFSRETLQDSIKCGRQLLESISLSLLKDDEQNIDNITMFTELTNAVLNGVKVHSQLYKDFSVVLVNLKKVNSNDSDTPKNVTNNLNIGSEVISTIDLIEKLRNT